MAKLKKATYLYENESGILRYALAMGFETAVVERNADGVRGVANFENFRESDSPIWLYLESAEAETHYRETGEGEKVTIKEFDEGYMVVQLLRSE